MPAVSKVLHTPRVSGLWEVVETVELQLNVLRAVLALGEETEYSVGHLPLLARSLTEGIDSLSISSGMVEGLGGTK